MDNNITAELEMVKEETMAGKYNLGYVVQAVKENTERIKKFLQPSKFLCFQKQSHRKNAALDILDRLHYYFREYSFHTFRLILRHPKFISLYIYNKNNKQKYSLSNFLLVFL